MVLAVVLPPYIEGELLVIAGGGGGGASDGESGDSWIGGVGGAGGQFGEDGGDLGNHQTGNLTTDCTSATGGTGATQSSVGALEEVQQAREQQVVSLIVLWTRSSTRWGKYGRCISMRNDRSLPLGRKWWWREWPPVSWWGRILWGAVEVVLSTLNAEQVVAEVSWASSIMLSLEQTYTLPMVSWQRRRTRLRLW